MSIRIRHCLTIVCDGCGKGPEDFNDEGWTPHYDTLEAAIEQLVDDSDTHGWLMTPKEHLCPTCRGKRACELVGHDWSEWWAPSDARGISMSRRMCYRCPENEIALAEEKA